MSSNMAGLDKIRPRRQPIAFCLALLTLLLTEPAFHRGVGERGEVGVDLRRRFPERQMV